MRILVTGGAGFIGSHLVEHLIDLGHEVTIADNMTTGKKSNIPLEAKVILASCEDYHQMKEVFEKVQPEVVYHLAGQTDVTDSIHDPERDMQWNYESTLTLLYHATAFNVHKVIYSSSSAVYGDTTNLPIKETESINPQSPYGLHKYASEKLLEMMFKNYTIFRFANVYGKRNDKGVIDVFKNNVQKGEPITIYGDGQQTRDFIHVEDVVRALILALDNGNRMTFNLSNNQQYKVERIARLVVETFGKQDIELHYLDKRSGEIEHSMLDNTLIQDKLGWEPNITLEKGLKMLR